MLSSSSVRSYLHLHFLVVIWGFTAIVGLMVTISPVALVLYRTLFAAIGLGVVIISFKQKICRSQSRCGENAGGRLCAFGALDAVFCIGPGFHGVGLPGRNGHDFALDQPFGTIGQ
jgi:hypothetical protein